jgi:hypothetical protein
MASSSTYYEKGEKMSPSLKNKRYLKVSPKGHEGHVSLDPHTSLRIREPSKINRANSNYLKYSVDDATSDLKLNNSLPQDSSVFPRKIYEKEPFGGSISYLIAPRDINLLYTYSPRHEDEKERTSHPLTASRFGWDRFPNEYGLGPQSRGYVEPPECSNCAQDTPKNMAPNRFYTAHHLKGTPTEFRKMNDERNFKIWGLRQGVTYYENGPTGCLAK